MLKRIASLLWVSMLTTLVACGGGSNPGTNLFNTTGASGPSSSAASVDVLTSATQIGSVATSTAIITAVVKDSGNNSLPSVPVSFTVDTGLLTNVAATTNASGEATATLGTGSNFSNRTIHVTVKSGGAVGTLNVQVVGTTLTFNGPTTVPLGGAVTVGVKATDSGGNPISNLALTPSSSLGNGLSVATVTTDTTGSASLTYTATNAGSDTLTFSGGGATSTSTILISAASFSFLSPAADTQITVGASQAVTVQYLINGAPQAGKTISFSSTAGTVSPASAVTNASGQATVNVSSASAASAVVQATVAGNLAQVTLPVVFVSTTPARVVLEVSPTAIAPNSAGSSAQQAQVLATVTDVNGNPVAGVTVSFNRVADPSGGTLSQPSALTNLSGQATVQYISGALTTPSNGVQLQATVLGTAVVSPIASMTVNQSALFIALGTDNLVATVGQNYQKTYSIIVTDANGVAVPNVVVTMKVLPVYYEKGVLAWDGNEWSYSPPVYQCLNEDTDYSGIYTAAKDFNGNGKLDPGNVISVSTANANGSFTTNASGVGTATLIYAESYAPWVTVKLQAQAIVSGTESTNSATFTVPGAAADFTNKTVPPAGAVSPFGVQTCNLPN